MTEALAQLQRYGICIIDDALDQQTLAHARAVIYRAIDEDLAVGRAQHGFGLDRDERNVRVWNLLNRDPVFAALAEHPLALQLVRATLGWPALLSNISANVTGPGAIAGVLHADQIFVPEPWPMAPQGVNVAWCIDDFTAHNGATEVVVGSHRLNRAPVAADRSVPMLPIEAKAGSIVAFEDRKSVV